MKGFKALLFVIILFNCVSLKSQEVWQQHSYGDGRVTLLDGSYTIIGTDSEPTDDNNYIKLLSSTNKTVSFNWVWTGAEPSYDYFYYRINGGSMVDISDREGINNQSNTFSINLLSSDDFEIGIKSDYCCGTGQVTISSITFSEYIPPTFAKPGPITICQNGSYYLAPSTTIGIFSSSEPLVATVNSSGYVTGLTAGTTNISLTTVDGTVTANITVGTTSSLTITDPNIKPNYNFDGSPYGPLDGTINYVGYNGFTYSSQIQPTYTGKYRASKQVGNEAGCPVEFYIIKCDGCQ